MPALTERTSKTTFASRQCSTSPDTPYSTNSEHNVNCQLGIVIRWLQHFDVKSSQVKYRLLHGRLEKIGEASADTAATETYYMKGYYNLEEETIKVKI